MPKIIPEKEKAKHLRKTLPKGNRATPRPPAAVPEAKKAKKFLAQLVSHFEKKGWLEQPLRFKYGDKRYRLFCSLTGFLAYRINDHCGISPGIPGWPVCFITPEKILEEPLLDELASSEPGAQEWLQLIVDEKLELI
jgi:hypothetical protein